MAGQAAEKEGERQGDFVGGKYLLEECLGIGGMGEVYRATNVSLGRKVAIKLLNKEHTSNEDDVLRFLREARAAAAVRHPNVVDVFDVARDDDGTPFIVQELLAGEDLEQYLGATRDGRVPTAEALAIMIPVAEAVAAAHALNVVHRDLKPANIFLAREGNKIIPKVLDFGACLYQTVGVLSAKEQRMLIGTPHYMAPEQITTAKEVDERADVWALGVILFEMLSGDTPFEAPDGNAVMKMVRTRAVPLLRRVAPDAPERLEQLVQRCLDRDRKKRFANAAELREELDQIRKQLAPGPRTRIDTLPEPDDELPPSRGEARSNAVKPAQKGRDGERKIDPRVEQDLPSGLQVPSLVLRAAKAKRRRGSSLLNLSAPDDDAAWDDSPRSASRPIEAALPVAPPKAPRTAADVIREADEASGVTMTERSRPPPSRDFAFDLDDIGGASIPPVLDPRSAGTGFDVPSPPSRAPPRAAEPMRRPEPPPPSEPAEPAPSLTPSLFPASPASVGPRAPSSAAFAVEASRPRLPIGAESWTAAAKASLAFAIVAPAFVLFLVLYLAPFIAAPLGHAMRGDSPLASGVLAVVALIGAAALATQALGAGRSRAMIVATVGAVLLGMVMIIVTFSASETAELGIQPAAAGIVPLLAPVVPLALGFVAFLRAREAWHSRYERREAITSVVLASFMLFAAVELGPFGAVRSVTMPVRTSHSP